MNYEEIALNIVRLIIFFVLNLYLLPWIITPFIQAGIKDDQLLSNKLNNIIAFIQAWTTHLLANILDFLVCFITGDIIYSTIKIEFDSFSKAPKIKYYLPLWKDRWFLLGIPVAMFMNTILHVILPLVISIISFRFLLPETFSVVLDGLEQWTVLSSGTPNLGFFANMWNAFSDIIWTRLIWNGLNENILLFLVSVFIMLVCMGSCTVVSDKEHPFVLKENIVLWVILSLVITIYNIVHANIDFAGYTTMIGHLNYIGMILLLILILKDIVEIIEFTGKQIVKIVTKKIT